MAVSGKSLIYETAVDAREIQAKASVQAGQMLYADDAFAL